ncbi:EAL domain-containing protein [Aquihabitans sp. G128]|uniref:EAL domain-containing protein n=1 Tax=Aquihabitans sp. G128 TaxID=2849779 RepID=UPI001C22C623|nr:EAL domain-containing protein [Aquihabitans sp. G128]QXC62151.1 EAL domain-containing protein [Aquihabitans sp. G128]
MAAHGTAVALALALVLAACSSGDGGSDAARPTRTTRTTAVPDRPAPQPGRPALDRLSVSTSGRPRVVDAKGNTVTLRGANLNALGDYYQDDPDLPPVEPPTAADWDAMAAHGFDVVRLIVHWSKLEPTRGELDQAYVSQIRQAVRSAGARGIYTVIDFHQDAWGKYIASPKGTTCGPGTEPAIGWDGAPEWATITDGADTCRPTGSREGAPAVKAAFANFYRNTDGIRDAYAATVTKVAKAFADDPMVAGYDLFNEPNKVLKDNDESSARYTDLLDSLITGIRAAEEAAGGFPHLLFLEPIVLFPLGGTMPTEDLVDDPNIVFAPHNYAEVIVDILSVEQTFSISASAAEDRGWPLWIGEYGVFSKSPDDLDVLRRFAAEEDRRLAVGSAEWQWRQRCGDPHSIGTPGGAPGDPQIHLNVTRCPADTDDGPNDELLAVVGRAYAPRPRRDHQGGLRPGRPVRHRRRGGHRSRRPPRGLGARQHRRRSGGRRPRRREDHEGAGRRLRRGHRHRRALVPGPRCRALGDRAPAAWPARCCRGRTRWAEGGFGNPEPSPGQPFRPRLRRPKEVVAREGVTITMQLDRPAGWTNPQATAVARQAARPTGRTAPRPTPPIAAGVLAASVLASLAAVLVPGAPGRGPGMLVALAATVAVALSVHRRRPATAPAWLLVAAGRLLSAAAGLDRPGRAVDGSTAPHLLNAVGFALTAWGLVVLARHLTRVWDRTRWIDSCVVALAIGLAGSAALAHPHLGAGTGWLGQWLTPLQPAVDLFLVLLATRSILAVRSRPLVLRLLLGSLVAQAVGDLGVRWLAPAGLGLPARTGTATTIVAAALLGAAAAHPGIATTPRSTVAWRRLGVVRFAVLVASSVLPLAVLVGLAAADRSSTAVVAYLATGAAVIGVLVLVRVSGLVSYADALADDRHRSRFEALVESSHDAVVVVDRSGLVGWASPAVTAVLGPAPDEVAGRPLDALVGHRAANELSGSLDRLRWTVRGTTVDVRFSLDPEPGTDRERSIEGVATNLLDDPAVEGVVVVVRDVTDRMELEAQLLDQAFVDPLTGLANRALFRDRVEHRQARVRDGDGRGPAVLFVDLDDFKVVNDSLGHSRGDELLAIAGRRIAEALAPGDTAARLGGDEFGVLLEDTTEAEAHLVADRILQLLAVPVLLGDFPVAVEASIGVALARSAAETASILLRNADLAMYEAKREGKGRVHLFHEELHERELRQFTFRTELGAALDRAELSVVYQPIVDMDTEALVGAEALLRWHHPLHGTISPLDFIPVAEATRAIVPIGRWVLQVACEQLAEWTPTLGPLSMDVNVSAVQLLDPGFTDDVAAVLAATGVAPERLVLELTESILVQDARAAHDVLDGLRALGVRLAIDDFGTGYSSLAYLQNFPIDIVKIDRTFVNQLGHDGRSRALAQSIIAIAGSLGIDTIAEGIETSEQAAAVSALDCLRGQGFHYSRPVEPAAFLALAHATAAVVD